MDGTWTIPSNSGRDEISVRFLDRWEGPDGEPVVMSEVIVRGDFWRSDHRGRGHRSTETARDFELRLAQFVMDEAALHGLVAALGAWHREPHDLTVELGAEMGEGFSLGFERENLDDTLPRYRCRLRCETVSLTRFEAGFVVDQSCLQILKDGLETSLARIKPLH